MFSSVMVEAVSKLLETTPTKIHMPARATQHVGFTPSFQIEVGMSREGWWILSHYCTPTNKVRVRAEMGTGFSFQNVHLAGMYIAFAILKITES